jgi:hypothetical protein
VINQNLLERGRDIKKLDNILNTQIILPISGPDVDGLFTISTTAGTNMMFILRKANEEYGSMMRTKLSVNFGNTACEHINKKNRTIMPATFEGNWCMPGIC